MVYARNTKTKQVSILSKIKVKFGKQIAKYFPNNKTRIWGLKLCGFNIGNKVYLGEDVIIASVISEKSCELDIGNRVAIGPRVTLILSSDANWSNLMNHIEYIKSFIVLEDDCWIGAGVIIMPGVTIGKCSIVGSGAVVTRDVPPYTVVAGIPAKKIKDVEKI